MADAAGAPHSVDWWYGDWLRTDQARTDPSPSLVDGDALRRSRTGHRQRWRASLQARRQPAAGAGVPRPRRLHRGVVVRPQKFLGACRTQRGCGNAESCRFRFDASQLTDPRTAAPPNHTCPDTPRQAWECVISRFAWELETTLDAMDPVPEVVPEHLDYPGLADRFLRYALHASATSPDLTPPATLVIRRPSDFYGDDVIHFLRRLAADLVWVDTGGPRLPAGWLDAHPNLGAVELVRAIAPLLNDQELGRLKRQLAGWRNLGSLRDDLLGLPELEDRPPPPPPVLPPVVGAPIT